MQQKAHPLSRIRAAPFGLGELCRPSLMYALDYVAVKPVLPSFELTGGILTPLALIDGLPINRWHRICVDRRDVISIDVAKVSGF